MSIGVIVLALILGYLFIKFKRWSKLYGYWKERGIVHRKPYPIVGNMLENVLKRKTMGEIASDIAYEFRSHKYVGLYNFITADLLITDPDDIQRVCVNDFSYFMDRGPKFQSKRLLDKHLFLLTGAQWKGVRNKVSPAFSSGKLKNMQPLMLKSYDSTKDYLDKLIKIGEPINLNDILNMYVVSVSASTIYGLDPAKMADPDCKFKRSLDSAFKMTPRSFVAMTIAVFFPKLSAFLNLSQMGRENEKYFTDLVLDTFKERSTSGRVRDDIIQQLLQLKRTGKIEVSQWIHEDEEELGSEPSTMTETVEITDEILISQGFIFLLAGFDGLKVTVAMLLVELCKNRTCLEKVVQEIRTCREKHGEFSHQAVKEMQYLDWCLSETLRLHPPAELITRHCVREYTFPDGPTVQPNTRVLIPILHVHLDPNNHERPLEFRPERFETPPKPSSYLPFGEGPRMCIARRFALQEMKLFAARVLFDYDIKLSSKTELPVRKDNWFFLRRHASEIYVDFIKRT